MEGIVREHGVPVVRIWYANKESFEALHLVLRCKGRRLHLDEHLGDGQAERGDT